MQERIEKIIEFLIEEIFVRERSKTSSVEELSKLLLKKGFTQKEIHRALEQLLHTLDMKAFQGWKRRDRSTTPALRILIPEELSFFSKEAYGYLIQLQVLGLIDALKVEQIIERCFLMGMGKVGIDDVKTVVSQFLLGKELGTFDTDAVFYPGNDKLN